MDLIERYIYSVGRHLPGKNRRDIENELRSLIMDALDERTQGNTPTETDIVEVLKELGEPSRMARNYIQEGSYIIGPKFYNLYMLLVKISLAAATFGISIAFIIEAIGKGVTPLDFLRLGGQLLSALFSCVGVLTLVFALTERINPDLDEKVMDQIKPWDPKDLPKIPDTYETVKISEQILVLTFSAAFFILLNFFPHLLGFFSAEKGQFVTIIGLGVLQRYLPLINILFGLSLIGSILLMAEGRYRGITFALEMISGVGTVILAVLMLSGPSLVDVSLIENPELKETLSKVFSGVYRGILIVMILAGIAEVARYGYRWVRSSKA